MTDCSPIHGSHIYKAIAIHTNVKWATILPGMKGRRALIHKRKKHFTVFYLHHKWKTSNEEHQKTLLCSPFKTNKALLLVQSYQRL